MLSRDHGEQEQYSEQVASGLQSCSAGVEVPPGKPTSCPPGDGMHLHVSQAALGKSKAKSGKENERVILKVLVDDSEIVLGTLSEGKCDQMQLDLVFDREFKVSHSSSSSSIYLCGYRTECPEEYDSEDEHEDEEEDDEEDANVPAAVPIEHKAGKVITEVAGKAATAAANAVQKAVKKQVVQDDVSDEEDDEEDSDDDMDEEDDEDESDESEEEELKVEAPKAEKKRAAAEPATKVVEKKSKTDASPKPASGSGGKKGVKGGQAMPVANETPKTPTDKGVKPAKTPKGTPTAPPTTPVSEKKSGQYKCTGCDRTFTSELSMSQHIAAKHKA